MSRTPGKKPFIKRDKPWAQQKAISSKASAGRRYIETTVVLDRIPIFLEVEMLSNLDRLEILVDCIYLNRGPTSRPLLKDRLKLENARPVPN